MAVLPFYFIIDSLTPHSGGGSSTTDQAAAATAAAEPPAVAAQQPTAATSQEDNQDTDSCTVLNDLVLVMLMLQTRFSKKS